MLPTPHTVPAPLAVTSKNILHFYAFGNTVPENLFLRHSNGKDTLSALILGCGDLRNMLYTLLQRTGKHVKMDFVLNDMQPEIVARNLCICYAVVSDPKLSAKHVMQLWYSLELDMDVHAYWTKCITDCLAGSWRKVTSLDVIAGLELVESCWRKWLACSWDVHQLRRERALYLEAVRKVVGLFKSASHYVEGISNAFFAQHSNTKPELMNELTRVLTTGNVCTKGGHVNPTLLLATMGDGLSYALHYGTNIFEGVHWDGKSGLISFLRKSVDAGMTALRTSSFTASFVVGHALLCLDTLAMTKPSLKFDVIETSNLADHLGLFNLVVQCPPFLKTADQSILKVSTFLHANVAETREEYLKAVVGLPLEAYPSWLGVELFVPDEHYLNKGDDWNRSVQPFAHDLWQFMGLNDGRNYLFYYFIKARLPSKPMSLSYSPFLVDSALACMNATSVSSHQKCDGPGGCSSTGHSFAKMVATAFAQQRISVTSRTKVKGAFPMPGPSGLASRIFCSVSMRGTMAELFVYLNAYGFPNYGDSLGNIYFKHTFDLVKDSTMSTLMNQSKDSTIANPTPIYFLTLSCGGVTHHFESIWVEEVAGNKVRVEALLPDFGIKDMKIQLMCKTPTSVGLSLLACASNEVTVDQCQWSPSLFSHKLVTAGLMLPPCQDGILKVDSIVEEKSNYLAKLMLGPKTQQANFSLKEGLNGLLLGIGVDSNVFKLQMPCPVTVSSFKIHRKSGFILVGMRKLPLPLSAPVLSHSGLQLQSKFKLADIVTKVGAMFMVKGSRKMSPSLSKGDETWLRRMRDNLQIIFHNASKGSNTLITCDEEVAGMVVFHGLFMYPAIDSSHAATPMLDASYVIAGMGEMTQMHQLRKMPPPLPLSLSSEEMPVMVDLLEFMHCNTADKSVHASLKLCPLFKRCIVYPIYAWSPVKLEDESKSNLAKIRKESYANRDMSRKMMEQMKGMDLSNLSSMFEDAGNNPQEQMKIMDKFMAENPKIFGSLLGKAGLNNLKKK